MGQHGETAEARAGIEVVPGVRLVYDMGRDGWIAEAEPDKLREQDVNAHLMEPEKFAQLVQNMKRRGIPESTVYCALTERGVEIVSGHHRVRAARAAGLKRIPIILDLSPLSRSAIAAKQLAHNALVGTDDPDVLRAIVAQITELDDLMESFIGPQLTDLPSPLGGPGGDGKGADTGIFNPKLVFEWQTLTFAFLPHQMKDLDALVQAVARSKPQTVGAAPLSLYEPFCEALLRFARALDVRNTSAALAALIELANEESERLGVEPQDADAAEAHELADDEETPATEQAEKWVPLARVVGRATIPAGAAKVIQRALDTAEKAGEVHAANKWQLIEWLCADYLGGEQ